jgi:hypothetical protein
VLAKGLTIEHGLTIVTRGFDIFVRILRFANEHRPECHVRLNAGSWEPDRYILKRPPFIQFLLEDLPRIKTVC